MPIDPIQQSVWERMMRNQSAPIDANLPPDLNMMLTGGQREPQSNPNFDPATLLQSQNSAPVPGVKVASNGPISLGEPLPMNPFLSGNNAAAAAGSARKATAESMFYDLLKSADKNPSLDAQKQTVDDYAAKVKAYADKPTGGFSSLNLAPLAALADSWSGSKLAQAYTPPESAGEHNQKVIGMQGNLAALQGNLTKEQTDLLKDKLAGLVGIDKANKDSGMTNSFIARADETNHRTNLQDLKNNKPLQQRLQQSTNLANAMSVLDNAVKKPPQQLSELQQTIRANMGIKGTSGLGEREKDYFNNAGLDADRLQQYLFGSINDVGESQAEVISHLRDMVGIEQRNVRAQADQMMNTQISGQEAMYQRRPDLFAGLQNALKASQGQFSPESLAPSNPAAPAKKVSKYDGMTDEQIQALHGKLGKS